MYLNTSLNLPRTQFLQSFPVNFNNQPQANTSNNLPALPKLCQVFPGLVDLQKKLLHNQIILPSYLVQNVYPVQKNHPLINSKHQIVK